MKQRGLIGIGRHFLVFALVAGLLAASCTAPVPEEDTPSGLGGALEQVRYLKPVEKIDANFSTCGRLCVPPPPQDPARDLIAKVRQEKPVWSRYLRSVSVYLFPGYAHINTGIVADNVGKVEGHKICEWVLSQGTQETTVLGVGDTDPRADPFRTLPLGNKVLLAKCRARPN